MARGDQLAGSGKSFRHLFPPEWESPPQILPVISIATPALSIVI